MTEAPDLVRLTSPDGRLEAFIAPDTGAELSGLAWEGQELLFRGRDFSSTDGWTGRAPILWPAIGRTFAPGPEPTPDTFRYASLGWIHNGLLHPMPMHGFARSMAWSQQGQTASSLKLTLVDNFETRRFYPFGFRLILDYGLDDGILTLTHRVMADRSNTAAMPFVLGNHATFVLPTPVEGGKGATISSNAHLKMALDKTGRPTGDIIDLPGAFSARPVSSIKPFDVTPLATADDEGWIRLELPNGPSITVSHSGASPAQPNLEFITIWGDPPNGYIALEPWLGRPNALSSGVGCCSLLPGADQIWVVTIAVGQDPRIQDELGR